MKAAAHFFWIVVYVCMYIYTYVGRIKYSATYLFNRFSFQNNVCQNAM